MVKVLVEVVAPQATEVAQGRAERLDALVDEYLGRCVVEPEHAFVIAQAVEGRADDIREATLRELLRTTEEIIPVYMKELCNA